MRDKCEDDAFLVPFPYCGLGLLSLVLLRWVDDVEASDSYHFWFLNTRKRDFEKEKTPNVPEVLTFSARMSKCDVCDEFSNKFWVPWQ